MFVTSSLRCKMAVNLVVILVLGINCTLLIESYHVELRFYRPNAHKRGMISTLLRKLVNDTSNKCTIRYIGEMY